MTFYEAALRILESAGRPLHFQEITEKSIAENLLSHVGKTPEQTMLSRLAAMARRTRDRRVVVTAKDTFALADWALPEDPEALAQTGIPEPNPEEDLPPYRPVERHPEPHSDNVRALGRGSERKRRHDRDDERGRRKRFSPVPEVVFEILSELSEGLQPEELLESARGKELVSAELSVEVLLVSLLEDNQRRIDAGRRPQFLFSKTSGLCTLERSSDLAPQDLQAAFAAALGVPFENGRPVFPRAASAVEGPDDALFAAAKTAVKEARRASARALRKRLSECDNGAFEKSVVRMLQGLGFRELKVAKRSKEGPLLTARKKEGSVELRYAIRLLKGNAPVDRRAVQDLRKDLGHYAAQVGLMVSAGDVRGDARTEAQSSGPLAMLWCGDALGEKFLEAQAGVRVVSLELFVIDERFFELARVDGEESARRREERRHERREEEQRDEQQRGSPAPEAVESVEGAADVAVVEAADEGDAEGDAEDDDASDAAGGAAPGNVENGQAVQPGQPGERKRRRRRRRGRRGRGSRPESASGVPGTPAGGAGAGEAGAAAAESGAPFGESGAPRESAPVAPPHEASDPPRPPPSEGGESA
ncbi:MAG: HTH domain-containing protein [Myxococcaceae bacterium]